MATSDSFCDKFTILIAFLQIDFITTLVFIHFYKIYLPFHNLCLFFLLIYLDYSACLNSLININSQTQMSALIACIPTSRPGLNYLVPTKWWTEFSSLNKQISNIQAIQTPPLQLNNFVDHFLLNYQSQLIESIQEKCLYLNFHQVKINPEIHQNVDWTPVSPQLWRAVNRKLKERNGIFTYVDQQKSVDIKKLMQLQLIYCSKTRSQLFVGYMPKNANLIALIRDVGFELGFVEVTRSKITFVERSPQVAFSFHQLEKYTVETSPDIFLMMFNMQRKEDDELLIAASSPGQHFDLNRIILNESNQAVVGDFNTMSDDTINHLNQPIRNRTISTGAETPFSFALSEGFDLDREYRVNELFGAKDPEEIEEMKQYALEKINHKELISVPIANEEKHKTFLERLAEQMLEGLAKRRPAKEKQVQKAYQ